MSDFVLIANGVVLTVGPYARLTAAAREQAQRGQQVTLRRATPADKRSAARTWAVEVSAADQTDVLACQDEADARTTLAAVMANGIRARIVRP